MIELVEIVDHDPGGLLQPLFREIALPVEPLDARAVGQMEMRDRVRGATETALFQQQVLRTKPQQRLAYRFGERGVGGPFRPAEQRRQIGLRRTVAGDRGQRLGLGRQQQIGAQPFRHEPSPEARNRRQRCEDLEPRHLAGERVDDPLDQEIAEADPVKAALAVRDRVEDRAVGGVGVAVRRGLVEQRMDVAGHALDERHLDEDQGFVRHARMEEREAAAIGLQPILEVGPALDLVHRLVGDELFQQRCRRLPADLLQFEKADVKPVGQKLAQILGEAAQRHVAAGKRDQLAAAVDQELDAFGQRVELSQEPQPRRRQRGAHRLLGGGALGRNLARREPRAAAIHRGMVDVELLGQHMQEALASGSVERQVGAAELRGAGPGADFSAGAVEAALHLLAQALRVVLGQVGPWHAAQDAARRTGDVAPDIAQLRAGAVDDRVEKTDQCTLAHAGPTRVGAIVCASCCNPARAAGSVSIRSSATRPTPKRRAASPCSQAAAQAVSKAGMPWASSPSTMPASTSPEPAVASSGGAFSLIAARPSGAAITVSAPFSKTTAPLALAARSARSSLLPEASNSRANSPSCGVNTQGERIASNKSAGLSAKTVKASASSTARLPAARILAVFSRVAAPAPAPGPIRAPPRAAARAASRPSPVITSPPAISAWPREYLWPIVSAQGNSPSHNAGLFAAVFGATASRTLAAMPICATLVSPQFSRPGSSKWPGLRRKKVTVSAAFGATPRIAPLAPSTPLGTSTATTGRSRAFSAPIISAAMPPTARVRPAPNSASTTSPAPSSAPMPSGSTVPGQRDAANAASPFSPARSPSSASRTAQPRSARMHAATNPSPPLFPGPHSTATGRGGHRRLIASATARPALSISTAPATPPAIVSRSASPICRGVNSARRRRR